MVLLSFSSLVLFLLVAVGVAMPRPVPHFFEERLFLALDARDTTNSEPSTQLPTSLPTSPVPAPSENIGDSSLTNLVTSPSASVSVSSSAGVSSVTSELPSPTTSTVSSSDNTSPTVISSSILSSTPGTKASQSLPPSILSGTTETSRAVSSLDSTSVPFASSITATSLSLSGTVHPSDTESPSASVLPSSLMSSSAILSSGTVSASRVPLPSPTTGPEEIREYLDGHNIARRSAGSRPLSWDTGLADLAKSYASQCRLQHSNGALGPFGENLVAGTGKFTANAAVALFTSDRPSGINEFTHWTQVVWKSTTQLGCGVALCDHMFGDEPATYHVCLYDPVGNVVGEQRTDL